MKQLFLGSILLLLVACASQEKKNFTIFYTADEHGWMNDSEQADGAAALMSLWQEREQYALNADSFLVLSGGDMWTGSSVSTWFAGRSMAEVMNHLGYDVAALGNHEFDFSVDTLLLRAQQSAFPFLSANIVDQEGQVPAYIQPYAIIEVNGVQMGLLGLSNIETPHTANPKAVKDLQFIAYDEAVSRYVPEMEKKGADVILIVGHLCEAEMEALAPLAKAYNIPLITGGHCHKQVLKEQDGVLLIESEAYLRSYIKVELAYDKSSDKVEILHYEAVPILSERRDEETTALVNRWEERANSTLNTPIAYTLTGIKKGSSLMKQLVAESWLVADESADVVIVNAGGVRQDIEPGEITLGTILGLLPFNNQIVRMKISGKDLNAFLQRQKEMAESYIISGVDDEQALVDDQKYTVLTTDFLYALQETQFKADDPSPYYTGVLYREPSISWLKQLATSSENPLEQALK